MINRELSELITSTMAELPDYMREALSSFDWLQMLLEIGAKYRLSDKQINIFVSETALVLMEVVDASLYHVNLMNHVGVSDAIATTMVLDVKNRIIDRLQRELSRIVGQAPDALQDIQQGNTIVTPGTATVTLPNVPMAPGHQPAPTARHSGDPYREPLD